MKKYKIVNNIGGWTAFIIATIVYLATMEPTASFWDCGEFIASAYKLEVGHPPGAPFFMLLGNFFTTFASKENVALMVNAMSALASSFTILFLFWTITHMAKKIIARNNNELTLAKTIAIIGSGMVGALAYTFSDTFWFSAVEGEVYATSSLFTAVVFWAILKWESAPNKATATRWIILIAYLMGLSIGVHLLNLLAIPAIVFVVYFKKSNVTRGGILTASIVAIILLAELMWGVIPGLVTIASKFELLAVNGLGMPFNSGVFIYIILLLAGLVSGIYFTQFKHTSPTVLAIISGVTVFLIGSKSIVLAIIIALVAAVVVFLKGNQNKAILNTIFVAFTVVSIGYSSYTLILVRSSADTPMDQNDPESMFGLLRYLNREQYGQSPLVSGQYFNAPIKETIEKKHSYKIDGDQYSETTPNPEYKYDPEFTTIFPRMWSSQSHHVDDYIKWTGMSEKSLYRPRTDQEGNIVTNKAGETVYDRNNPRKAPGFSDNIKFFTRYQIGFMYLRYFMWNFAGRQNDLQGHGEPHHGNWISGIRFIDEARLGDLDNLPEHLKNNDANNKYYMLPLLLGLFGLIFQFLKNKRGFAIVTLLFFFTGIAIVLYLNQYPHQPRERDYAFAASFYAFAIWIGLGVLALFYYLERVIPSTASAAIVTLVGLGAVPTVLALENWDDHDRSGRYTARDFAINYLESCAPNSILFTNGDNDTFPLWYVQEVEGIRTDVRVANLSYLSADWYIEQMKRKYYVSDTLPIIMTKEEYAGGSNDVVYLIKRMDKSMQLQRAMQFLLSDDPKTKSIPGYNESIDHFPTKTFTIPADSQNVVDKMVVGPDFYDRIDTVEWTLNRRHVIKNHLVVLDILAHQNWERPVYFAVTVSNDNYLDLERYFQQQGLAYRVVPVQSDRKERMGMEGSIDGDIMYDNMMNKFKWGGIDDPDIYLDENNRRMISNFRYNFSVLASKMIQLGKTDSAYAVLEKCEKLISNDRVPYTLSGVSLVSSYYLLNDTAKANEIINVMVDQAKNELDYYLNVEERFIEEVHEDARIQFLYILRNLAYFSNMHGQEETAARIGEVMQTYGQQYASRYPDDF